MWFWIDTAASFPFDWLSSEGASGSANKMGRLSKIFRLLRMAKLLRIFKLGTIMARFRQATQVSPSTFLLGKTLVVMLATWHWSACGYWAIATMLACNGGEDGTEDQWCPPPSVIDEDDWTLHYSYAFFWGISATTGAGYEVLPNTREQIAYSALIIVLGSALYCNILASMTSIIQGFALSSTRKAAELETIFQYLRREPTTKHLRNQIRSYYDFMWTDGLGGEVSTLVSGLPKTIQMDVAAKMHAAFFKEIEMFAGMHSAAVFFLVQNWQRLYVVKGDTVIEQGTYSSDLVNAKFRP
jgi:hypothetical protein